MRIYIGIAALAALLCAMPAAARAQGPPPVSITDCSVLQWMQTSAYPYPFWRPFGPYPGASPYTDGIRISFVNHAAKTAARVAFSVNYRGDHQHIIDVGSFAPNVTIDHTFGQYTGDAWLGPKPNSCRVVAVRFNDGTVWRSTRPAHPQSREP